MSDRLHDLMRELAQEIAKEVAKVLKAEKSEALAPIVPVGLPRTDPEQSQIPDPERSCNAVQCHPTVDIQLADQRQTAHGSTNAQWTPGMARG